MKKKLPVCMAVIYLLLCCTLISGWVDSEMTLTGKTIVRDAGKGTLASHSVPSWALWNNGESWQLFYVVSSMEADGTESLSVREMAEKDFSYDTATGNFLLNLPEQYEILYDANRHPRNTETVVIPKAASAEKTVWLYSSDGAALEPIASQTETILEEAPGEMLLRTSLPQPFTQRELFHRLYPAGYAQNLWGICLEDLQSLIRALPRLLGVVLLVLFGLVLILANRPVPGLLSLAACSVGIHSLLQGCTIAPSVLPESYIFSFSHYRQLAESLSSSALSPALSELLSADLHASFLRCIWLLLAAAIAASCFFLRRKFFSKA